MSALGEDFLSFPDLPILRTGILIIQVPVLGAREEENSNLYLTADVCEQKRLGDKNPSGLCFSEPKFFVKRVHLQLDNVLRISCS